MNLLLDTHTFLWWHGQRDSLPVNVRHLIEDANNEIYLSIASIWEIQIKHQLGKLELRTTLSEMVEKEVDDNDFTLLLIGLPHVMALESLPLLHKDPFDRILVAQAYAGKLTLVSGDNDIKRYPVPVIW